MEVTRELAEFVSKVTFDDLPEDVVERTKQILLDCIGCALGSYVIDRAKIAIELAEDFGGSPQATIIGNRRTSCALAAFVNAELINALDYDPGGPAPHTTIYVTSPSLAIAERVKASGKDLILAIALAHEIGGRAALSVAGHRILNGDPPHWEDTQRYSYTSTVFGSVSGAGKLLRLDSRAMANALGIAGASTPVPAMMKWEYTPGPAFMVKYNLWAGWVSQLATTAALAAQRGFTGDTTILDGEWGFWKIVGSPFVKMDILLGDLGKKWRVPQVKFKAYPCVGMNHPGMRAIRKIVDENAIKPEDIEDIFVGADPKVLMVNRAMTEIKTFEDTQFSNAYTFAVAACYAGKPGPGYQLPSTFDDPVIRRVMSKVRIAAHPRADELLAKAITEGRVSIFNTVVELTAKGRKYTVEVADKKGSPTTLVTDEELKEKFRNNADYSPLKRDKIEKVIETVYGLEKLGDVTKLMELLTVG